MRLRSRETERRLQPQARQRIFRSPRLRVEYRRQRRARRWQLLGQILAGLLFVFLGGWMLIVAPAMLAAATRVNGLVLVTLVSTVLSWFLGCGLVHQFRRARELAIFSCLPLHDHDIIRLQVRQMFALGLLALIPCASFYISALVTHQLPPARALAAGLCGLLVWIVTLALPIVLTAVIPRWLDAALSAHTLCTGAVLGLIASVFAANQGIAIPWREIADATFRYLPAGWVNSAFSRGVIQRQGDAWWMLLPVGIVLILVPIALGRIRRAYRVREISFSEQTAAEAVFENPRFWEPISRRTRAALAAQRRTTAEADEEHPLVDPRLARRRVLSGEFLREFDWHNAGWIERAVGTVLNERERAILELLQAKPPHWSRNLKVAILIVATLGMALMIVPRPLLEMVLMGLAFAPLSLIFGETCPAARWKCGAGQMSLAAIFTPVSYREVWRVVMVIGCIRGLFLLPLAAGLGALILRGFGGSATQGAAVGAKIALVCMALHYWSFVAFAGVRTDKRSILRQLWEAVPYIALGLAFAGAAVFFVIAPLGPAWSTPAAALVFACGWAAMRYDERIFNRTAFDLVGVAAQSVQKRKF